MSELGTLLMTTLVWCCGSFFSGLLFGGCLPFIIGIKRSKISIYMIAVTLYSSVAYQHDPFSSDKYFNPTEHYLYIISYIFFILAIEIGYLISSELIKSQDS